MQDHSFPAFMDFLHYMGNHGLIKATTAQGYRVAASKIESSLTEQEMADVRHIDVPTVFQRYVNKQKVKVAPGTLRTYQGRLETALADFGLWRTDPTNFRPRSGPRPKGDEKKKTKAPGRRDRTEPKLEEKAQPQPQTGPGILTLPYPLRTDFLASVQIPRDLKAAEAERLAAFIRTLAVDYSPANE